MNEFNIEVAIFIKKYFGTNTDKYSWKNFTLMIIMNHYNKITITLTFHIKEYNLKTKKKLIV